VSEIQNVRYVKENLKEIDVLNQTCPYAEWNKMDFWNVRDD